MTWHAKPSGSYDYSTGDGLDNLWEMAGGMTGWSDAAKAGAIGNSVHEGGMNPWRWQYDSSSQIPNGGYGLFQYTPGSGYTNLSGATPNMSVTSQTTGATPQDGAFQVSVLINDTLSKWVSSCWRSYWDTTLYASLYSYRQDLLNQYGNGSTITMAQYAAIPTDVEACTFIFLACFEGPAKPNYTNRKNTALDVYNILTGGTPPPTPPTPPPTPPVPGDFPWAILFNRDKWRKT